MNKHKKFALEVTDNIKGQGQDKELKKITSQWIESIVPHKYTHNFSWLGRPIIQFPQDIHALQEVIWDVKPDLIIETGIAHGGSLIFNASILAMLEYCDAIETNTILDPQKPKRHVLGIDIDIRKHNHEAIIKHPMSNRIKMLQGSSIDTTIISQVRDYAKQFKRVIVILDSNHTHDHVLAELEAYASLVNIGSYCIVFDSVIEDMPDHLFTDRPWGKGNNPKTALTEFLSKNKFFKVDKKIENKLLITVASNGYLKREA